MIFDDRSIDFIEFVKELDDLNKFNILASPPVGNIFFLFHNHQ